MSVPADIASNTSPPRAPVTTTGNAIPARRGILYLKWGKQLDPTFQRSLTSVRKFHPELPVHIAELPADASLLDKATMFDLSPFEETLFLDVDTVVLDHLEFGFEKAVKFGIACCICEVPWARRYPCLSGDTIEYNTGVLFFSQKARPLFDSWKNMVNATDSSTLFRTQEGGVAKMPSNDQAAFAKAMEDTGTCPCVLPINWNLRPTWQNIVAGPIKIWHAYSSVHPWIEAWNQKQNGEEKIIEFVMVK